jgi:hypothetical protein
MRHILSFLFALCSITTMAQSQDSVMQKKQDAFNGPLNKFPKDRTEYTADQLKKPIEFEWQETGSPGEKVVYTLAVYRIQPNLSSLQNLVKARPVFTTQVTGNSTKWQIPEEFTNLKENSAFAWAVSSNGRLPALTDFLSFSVFTIIGPGIPWPLCSRSWVCPAVSSYSLCSNVLQQYNIPAAAYSATGFCPFASFPLYSIDGQPTVPYAGNNITVNLSPGQHTIVFTLFSFAYPVLTCSIQVNIFPRITAMIDKPEICNGEDATVSIPPFPALQGYSVTWLYRDDSGPWLPAPGVAGSPAHTNAITPVCPPASAQNFVIRSYMPVITGSPSWPASCIQQTSIKVWCPTQAGTITVSPTPNYCATSKTFTLTYNGGVGTIIKWQQNGVNIPGTSSTITLTRAPGTWTYTVTVKNGACAEATASATIIVEAPLTATITGNTTEVCPNGSATLQLTSPVPAGTIINWEYQVNCAGTWTPSGVTGPVQNSNNIGNAGPYTPTPATSLCWRATVSSGTGICPPVTSNTWTINIIQAPCTPVITANKPLPKCPGSVVTLAASTSCGTGPFTYNWYLDGIHLGTGPTWPAVLPGEYTVEVFNKNNCESRISQPFTVSDCINIITITGPCNVPASTPIRLCAAVASDPNGAPCSTGLTYLWSSSAGPGLTPTQPCNNWNPALVTTTTYNVAVTNAMGCKTTASWTVKVCQ